jgi:hypothetical protein
MPKKIHLDEAVLRDLVENQELQQWKVAEILGVSVDLIHRTCKALGIKTQRTGPRSGPGHPEWKGGRRNVGGYIYVYLPDHPNATKQHGVLEHRLVMEQKLGRYLERHEIVHHLNNDTLDNRPENLAIYSDNTEHLRKTLKGQCPKWTPEGMERIQEGLKKRANQLRSGIGAPKRNPHTGRFETRRDTEVPQA